MSYLGSSKVASMVSIDGHTIPWLLAVLAALCPVGLYWPVIVVLVRVVLIGYINCVEFRHHHRG